MAIPRTETNRWGGKGLQARGAYKEVPRASRRLALAAPESPRACTQVRVQKIPYSQALWAWPDLGADKPYVGDRFKVVKYARQYSLSSHQIVADNQNNWFNSKLASQPTLFLCRMPLILMRMTLLKSSDLTFYSLSNPFYYYWKELEQSSWRAFGRAFSRAFSRAFGRAFIELRIGV